MNESIPMLADISSYWPFITDPAQFVLRYAPAIQDYLRALIKDAHTREEVLQDFLLGVVQRGFVPEQVTRGRFRDYLKAAVRNAALAFYRRRAIPQAHDDQLAELTVAADPFQALDREWLDQCRQVVIALALDKLAEHERGSPESRLFTVLRLTLDHPDTDSVALAARAANRTGRPMSPEGYRKQLSRARTMFAGLLIEEVKRTLRAPTASAVEEELGELGLLEYVRPFLSPA